MTSFALRAAGLCAATLLLAGTAQAATQTALDKTKKCEAQIPADWKPGVAGIGMQSADGKSTVLVSLDPNPSLAAIKTAMPSVFKITQTLEDSATRYWIAYAGDVPSSKTIHWYVATQQPGEICTLEFDYQPTIAAPDAKAIALSLKKH